MTGKPAAKHAPITLDALPLSELVQWLNDNQLPDARTFLLPGTAMPTVVLDGEPVSIQLCAGVVTMTWPGGTALSNPTALTVPQGKLGGALYFGSGIIVDTAFYTLISAPSGTGCNLYAESTGGSPPAGHTQQAYWLALVY